ncbi:MAG: hypothetical protein ACRDV6_10855 [Acidimicrobiales bacterium]
MFVIAVIAIIVALAAAGVAAWALLSVPRQGATGAAGPQGPRGAAGKQGPTGKTGPAGPVGTINAANLVRASSIVSAPDPPVGTVVLATTSCPAGQVLVSGGAQVWAPGAADRNVILRSSFPINATMWQVVSMVTRSLGAGNAMSMRPFVVCGTP